jgi:hypothetical protein
VSICTVMVLRSLLRHPGGPLLARYRRDLAG